MTSLFNITQEYLSLLGKETISPEDLAKVDESLSCLEDKAVQYAYVIQELEGKLSLTKDAIKNANDKKKRLENNIAYLKQTLIQSMQAANITKVDKDPMFDISLRKNPPSVIQDEDGIIPEEYFVETVERKINKDKIKKDIQELGLVIPGVKLVSSISLQIK